MGQLSFSSCATYHACSWASTQSLQTWSRMRSSRCMCACARSFDSGSRFGSPFGFEGSGLSVIAHPNPESVASEMQSPIMINPKATKP